MATINSTTGAKNVGLLGIGAYRPKRVVTNEEICERIDSTPEWIVERSGIRTRHHAGPDESVRMMSAMAAEQAIQNSGIPREKIGALLLATSTWPLQVPHGAPAVALDLGMNGIAAMDITAGCSGFGHALGVADSLIRGGTAEYVVVIGVEKMSDGLDMTDRTNCFIFGDGAGAVVVGPTEENGLSPVVWGSDGDKGSAIRQNHTIPEYMELGANATAPIGKMTLIMEGSRVFKWAAFKLGPALAETMEKAGVTAEDIEVFIPHQANARINEVMVRHLGFREGTPMANDIETTGNTSAASIPLAMEEMLRTGKAKGGQTALLLGFGAGLTYAGQVVKLPPAPQPLGELPPGLREGVERAKLSGRAE